MRYLHSWPTKVWALLWACPQASVKWTSKKSSPSTLDGFLFIDTVWLGFIILYLLRFVKSLTHVCSMSMHTTILMICCYRYCYWSRQETCTSFYKCLYMQWYTFSIHTAFTSMSCQCTVWMVLVKMDKRSLISLAVPDWQIFFICIHFSSMIIHTRPSLALPTLN